MNTLTATPGIRKGVTMSRMGLKKPKVVEKPISDDTFPMQKLDYYRQIYDGFEPFRTIRERAARFFNGEQWSDMTENENGEAIREDEQLMAQGQPPLIQNLIRGVIRSLEGQQRGDTSKSVVVARTPEKGKESEMLSNALQYSQVSVNNTKDLDARALEEFLISGLPIQRISWEYVPELKRKEVVVRNVNPTSWSCNADIEDIRGNDMRVMVLPLDYTMDEIIIAFGTTPKRKEKLKEIYSANFASRYFANVTDVDDKFYNKSFYVPTDIAKCRVIEVWEKRLVEQMNVHDWMDGSEWYCDWTQKQLDQANAFRVQKYANTPTEKYPDGVPEDEVPLLEGTMENVQKMFFAYYSPYGHILREGETPFEHGSHPFVATPYPLLDGKIVGLATDLIDTQKQVNSLLVMQRMILASSVKNTLVVDSNSLAGKSPEDVATAYRKIGGVVVLDLGPGRGVAPQELKGSIGNLGISEMIQIYLKMMQDVSGVNPAMQGQTAASGTSGKLYDAQISQSTMNSKDMMETFSGLFRRNRDMKLLKTIQQYYKEDRMLAIAGKSYTETAQLYVAELVKDIDFDLTIGQMSDSPVYRTAIEETLVKLLDGQFIDLKLFLENTTLPFSSKLLDDINKREAQAQTDPQGAVQGLTQDVQNAGVGGDMSVVNAVHQNLKAA